MSEQGVAGPHVQVGSHVANGWTVVRADDEIDIAFAPLVRAEVARRLADGHRHFVLDLCDTPFIDSMGLGMIVAVTKHIRNHAGSLRIACSDQRLLHVFALGGLGAVFSFHDTVEQAVAQPPGTEGLAGWPRVRA
ncbi:anti-anti-sigma factor [Streptomyces sp. M1013]|uniref:STAS domain-containing protein n=1 Tax=Streptomyces sp. M1013 TaxID=549798 RepID=UPI000978EEB5|nr:STAS domain-containing protein [Streptomyces sp. M1013]OMI85188.1 anti-anti-sigma factor [Streptomyces sp. M1013]